MGRLVRVAGEPDLPTLLATPKFCADGALETLDFRRLTATELGIEFRGVVPDTVVRVGDATLKVQVYLKAKDALNPTKLGPVIDKDAAATLAKMTIKFSEGVAGQKGLIGPIALGTKSGTEALEPSAFLDALVKQLQKTDATGLHQDMRAERLELELILVCKDASGQKEVDVPVKQRLAVKTMGPQ